MFLRVIILSMKKVYQLLQMHFHYLPFYIKE